MPEIDKNDERSAPPSGAEGFSRLAQAKADEIRDCVNTEELGAWLKEIAEARLGGWPSERKEKARAWLMGVGRKSVIRKGEATLYAPARDESPPEWAKLALARGRSLLRLSLPRSEENELGAICDWLKSEDGPALDSDWTRISRPQAREAEARWIKELGKRSARAKSQADDAAGTSLFAKIPGEAWAGWRWVKVNSPEALNREGELMSHCVGSYADEVADGEIAIYSLRDPQNKPKLTVEAAQARLQQLKAFANEEAGPEWAEPVGAFVSAFEKIVAPMQPVWSREWAACGLWRAPWNEAGIPSQMASNPETAERARAWGRESQGLADEELEFEAQQGRLETARLIMESGPSAEGVIDALGVSSNPSRARLHEALDLFLPKAMDKAQLLPNALAQWMSRYRFSDEELVSVERLISACPPEADWSDAVTAAARAGKEGPLEWMLARAASLGQEALDEALLSAIDSKSLKCFQLMWGVRERFGAKELTAEKKEKALGVGLFARLPDNELIRFLPEKKMKELSSALEWAIDRESLVIARAILPWAHEESVARALKQAARGGKAKQIKELAPAASERARLEALLEAIRAGSLSGARELLKWVDPQAEDSRALRDAARHGQRELVKLLLPLSDASALGYEALISACGKDGDDASARALINACEREESLGKALNSALDSGRRALLAELCRLAPAAAAERLEALKSERFGEPKAMALSIAMAAVAKPNLKTALASRREKGPREGGPRKASIERG